MITTSTGKSNNNTRLVTFFPGKPGHASTGKVENLDVTEALNDDGWQCRQLDHTPIICISLTPHIHFRTLSHNLYRPDALPDAQQTMSKQWWL